MQNKNHRAAIPNDWKQHEHTHTNVHACCHQGCTAKLADARVANEAITSVNMTTKVRSHHHSYQSTEATCQGQSCQVRVNKPRLLAHNRKTTAGNPQQSAQTLLRCAAPTRSSCALTITNAHWTHWKTPSHNLHLR
mmetsp:Transcript_49346/g.106235  ORF Transcript_49346/g.106235 Transcript_49346/m.106235 type:complete len:136 (-) Transcript_49346:1674-2081(-)